MKIVKQISEEGMTLKTKLDELQDRINKYKTEYNKLSQNCQHELRELTPEELKDEYMSEEAQCLICGNLPCFSGTWRCKSSPDSVCHYYSSGGKVRMVDDTLVNVPEGHNSKYENDDECIFCYHPYERK